MGILPPLLAFLGIAMIAAITVTGSFLGGSNEVLDARLNEADRVAELNGTTIELVAATYSGDVATLTFRNTGRVALRATESWDVWASTHDASGNYDPEKLTRSTTASATADEWALTAIYLDADTQTPESTYPGILNPGEEMLLTLNIEPDAVDPEANFATLALPIGASARVAFTWQAVATTPADAGAGASLATDATYVYALRGNSADALWRYDTISDSWSALTVAPFSPTAGGALTYATDSGAGYLYALEGQNQVSFERYDIDGTTWSTLADAPANADDGAALAWDGDNTIYALRGKTTVDFWSYNISGDAWSTRVDAPDTVQAGGALVHLSGALYALGGNGTTALWKFTIADDTWATVSSTPTTVSSGGAITTDGTDLYALRGGTQSTFWKYSVLRDTWTEYPSTPATVDWGGALTMLGQHIYGMRGNSTNAFWKYPLPVYTP
jgi:outer membrane protein assembly factor BamB